MKRTNTAKWIESAKRWQINVQRDGKRKTFTSAKPGRTGQREANAKADAWLDEGLEDRTIKVEAVYKKYLERQKKVTGKSNWRPIESRWKNWICPKIGHRRIESVSVAQLQDILDDATAAGKSRKYVRSIMGDISALWKYARLSGCTTLVPEGLRVPDSAPVGRRRILQPAEIIVLLNSTKTCYKGAAVEDEFAHAWRLLVLTGMRPGELLGLQWEDVHPGKITIQRSQNFYGEITPGKNDDAARTIILSSLAQEEIDAQRAQTGTQRLVFPPAREEYLLRRWRRYCNHNGITPVSLYELRHTFVSIAQSLPEAQVKALVGHAKSMDTWGVYGHGVDGGDLQIAANLDAAFANVTAKKG